MIKGKGNGDVAESYCQRAESFTKQVTKNTVTTGKSPASKSIPPHGKTEERVYVYVL